LEIDIVCNRGDERYYIQSALSVSDPEKRIQETKSLDYTNDSFKKIIITKGAGESWYDEKGVLTIDLFDFLERETIS
ncbi:MAG: ATP-binding protein, partial [Candidatus Saccharibacteria bacterium]|nr:ATP-binding protein [Candidatus Saccharibacteria bacterium]